MKMMPVSKRHHIAGPRHEEVALWFVRRTGPDWTPDDEIALERWLAAEEDNRRAFARWEADWALIDTLPEDAMARLRTQVAIDRAANDVRSVPQARVHTRRSALGLGVASVASAAGVLAAGWIGWSHWRAQPVYELAVQTQRGQRKDVRLPDGSQIEMDTLSALSTTFFRDRRQVHLEHGQAMFSVSADADRPFRVLAGGVTVMVVGTRFSVRLTPEVPGRGGVEVAVEEGKVWVSDEDHLSIPHLTQGQKLVFDAAGRPVLSALKEDIAPWRSSYQLRFSDTALETVIADIERYVPLQLRPADTRVAALRLSGTFDLRDVAGTRRLLAGALGLPLSRQADNYIVGVRQK